MASSSLHGRAAAKGRTRSKEIVKTMTLKVFFTLGSDDQSGPSTASNGTTHNKRKPLLARSPVPIPVRILRSRRATMTGPSRPSHATAEPPMFGEVALRPVLSAVCRSAPGLLSDSEKDYTVSALDPLDAWKGHQPRKERAAAAGQRARKGKAREDGMSEDEEVEEVEEDEGVWEGKGMMRWCLAENKAGPSSSSSSGQPSDPFEKPGAVKAKETVMVRGTVHGVFAEDLEAWANEEDGVDEDDDDDDERELEVHLQLISRPVFSRSAFLNQLGSPVRRSPRGHPSPTTFLNSNHPRSADVFALSGEPPVSPTTRKGRTQGGSSGGVARTLFSPPSPGSAAPLMTTSSSSSHRHAPTNVIETGPPVAAVAYLRALLSQQQQQSAPSSSNAAVQTSPSAMYHRILALASQTNPLVPGSVEEIQRRSARHLVGTMKSLGLISQDIAPDINEVEAVESPAESLVSKTGRRAGAGVGPGPGLAGKRKRTVSAGGNTPMSEMGTMDRAGETKTVYEVRDPADMLRDKRKREQWKTDEEGCGNCGARKSSCWMQLRKRADDDAPPRIDKLCYTCGQHWNKHGAHRPVKAKRSSDSRPSPAASTSGSASGGTPQPLPPAPPAPILVPAQPTTTAVATKSTLSFPPRPFKSVLSVAVERESQILQRNLSRRVTTQHQRTAPETSPSGKCEGRFAGVRPKPPASGAALAIAQATGGGGGTRKKSGVALLQQGIMTSPPRGSVPRGRQMSLPPGGPGGVSVTSPIRGEASGAIAAGKAGFAAGTAGGYASDGDGASWFDATGGFNFGAGEGQDAGFGFDALLGLDLEAFDPSTNGPAAASDASAAAADLFNSLDFGDPAGGEVEGFGLEPVKRPVPMDEGSPQQQQPQQAVPTSTVPPKTAARLGTGATPSIFSSSFLGRRTAVAEGEGEGEGEATGEASPSVALGKSVKRRKLATAAARQEDESLMDDAGKSLQDLMSGFSGHPSLLGPDDAEGAEASLEALLARYAGASSSSEPPQSDLLGFDDGGGQPPPPGTSCSTRSYSSNATVVDANGFRLSSTQDGRFLQDRAEGSEGGGGKVVRSGLSSAIRTRLHPFSRHSSSDRILPSDAASLGGGAMAAGPSSPVLPPPSDCSEGITPLSELQALGGGAMASGMGGEDEDSAMAFDFDVPKLSASSSGDDLTATFSTATTTTSTLPTPLLGPPNAQSAIQIDNRGREGGGEGLGLSPEILAAMSGALEAGWTTDALAEALKAAVGTKPFASLDGNAGGLKAHADPFEQLFHGDD